MNPRWNQPQRHDTNRQVATRALAALVPALAFLALLEFGSPGEAVGLGAMLVGLGAFFKWGIYIGEAWGRLKLWWRYRRMG